jgi:hypothetical protein
MALLGVISAFSAPFLVLTAFLTVMGWNTNIAGSSFSRTLLRAQLTKVAINSLRPMNIELSLLNLAFLFLST